jgi:ribosome-associated protein
LEKISINTDIIKLDQFLKWAGVSASGADAKNIILEGKVKVNNEIILQRGKKLHKGDIIAVEGGNEFIVE